MLSEEVEGERSEMGSGCDLFFVLNSSSICLLKGDGPTPGSPHELAQVMGALTATFENYLIVNHI